MLRKDESLKNTIKHIKNILKSLKMPIVIKKNNIGKKFFSVNIGLRKNKKIFTNGKGNSYFQALASGLAEFMERLQSGTLIPSNFLNEKNPPFYNEILYSNEYLKSTFGDIMYQLIEKKIISHEILNPNYSSFLTASDYFCENTKTNHLLPRKIIRRLTQTNGISSGNTKSECLTQGICEIFERYCFKTIILNNLPVNIIDIQKLKNLEIFPYINYIISIGYGVKILDFSLNQIYPVMGVMIFKNNEYCIAAGSDVELNIALFRCFNELFQGLNNYTLKSKLKPLTISPTNSKSNWLKFYKCNNGNINLNNITNNFTPVEKLPFKTVHNNIEAYDFVFNIIKQNNLKLFYKDFSFLGFCTFHSYIPTLSEIQNITKDDLYLINHFELCNQYYFNLTMSLTIEQKSQIINCLKIFALKNDYLITPSEYFKSKLNSNYYLNQFDFKYLLSISLVNFNYDLTEFIQANPLIFNKEEQRVIFSLDLKKELKITLKKTTLKKNKDYKIWKNYYNVLYKKYQEYQNSTN